MEKIQTILDDVHVDKLGVVDLEDCGDEAVIGVSRELLPEAKTVVVLGMELFPEMVQYLVSRKEVGELVLRDLFTRHMDIVNGHLDWESYKLVKALHERGFHGIPMTAGNAPFDNRYLAGMLSYKAAAVAAGMGVIGWNTMLLTPEYGPRIRLCSVITDAPFQKSVLPEGIAPCKACGGACIKVCPVNAIIPPSENEICHIDKYVCNTYITATNGCSECLKVCPAEKLLAKRK